MSTTFGVAIKNNNKIPTYGHEFDCVVEAKHKELAIVNYNK